MITTPGTDTPGIYSHDLPDLAWAALFAEGATVTGGMAALLGDYAPDRTDLEYPVLAGLARVNTAALLCIIGRLAEQAEKDAATIARQRAELLDKAAECGTLRGQLRGEQARSAR